MLVPERNTLVHSKTKKKEVMTRMATTHLPSPFPLKFPVPERSYTVELSPFTLWAVWGSEQSQKREERKLKGNLRPIRRRNFRS